MEGFNAKHRDFYLTDSDFFGGYENLREDQKLDKLVDMTHLVNWFKSQMARAYPNEEQRNYLIVSKRFFANEIIERVFSLPEFRHPQFIDRLKADDIACLAEWADADVAEALWNLIEFIPQHIWRKDQNTDSKGSYYAGKLFVQKPASMTEEAVKNEPRRHHLIENSHRYYPAEGIDLFKIFSNAAISTDRLEPVFVMARKEALTNTDSFENNCL